MRLFMAMVSVDRWEMLAAVAHYNAKKLANLCKLSMRQLERDFKYNLNCAPQKWLNRQRILAAKRLLFSGEPVKYVAAELYFKQPSHFCRHFKSYANMTPSQYIASCKAKELSPPMSLVDNNCRR